MSDIQSSEIWVQDRFGHDIVLTLSGSTNSTASDLPGLGRTLGHVLSMWGHALDDMLAKAAHKMGLGPNPALVRLKTESGGIALISPSFPVKRKKKILKDCKRLLKYSRRYAQNNISFRLFSPDSRSISSVRRLFRRSIRA